jgi:uncharacterized membrane-anchored protein
MRGAFAFGVVFLAVSTAVFADKPKPAPPQPPPEQPADEPADEPEVPHLTGPKTVDLGNQTELALPDGMYLYERDVAQPHQREIGNDWENVVAEVERPEQPWTLVFEYQNDGYVDDSDANELDAGELLKSIIDGTAEQNAQRKQLGVPELFVDRWSEPPRYDRVHHQLLWSIENHDVTGKVINRMTRILGRNGYLSVTLVASPEALNEAKVDADLVLAAVKFRQGARYEDHKNGDRDSGIGLKALVLGGAGVVAVKVAKAGILIKLLLVLKKALIFIVAGIAGFFRWLFGRKKRVELARSPSETPPDPG